MNNLEAEDIPGGTWRAILNRESLETFASAFTKEPVLVASVSNATLHGPKDIRDFFAASAGIYEDIAFIAEANVGRKTYLQWKGTAFGHKPVEGLTVLARNAAGLIERIELYHRPLSSVLAFAQELERRLNNARV